MLGLRRPGHAIERGAIAWRMIAEARDERQLLDGFCSADLPMSGCWCSATSCWTAMSAAGEPVVAGSAGPGAAAAGRGARLGGAANVALNIAALGGRAVLTGVVGDDDAGREIAVLLAAQPGIEPRAGQGARIDRRPARPASSPARQQLMRLDEETAAPVAEALAALLLDRFADALEAADIVILSDYAKGVLCDPVLERGARTRGGGGAAGGRRSQAADFSAYRGVDGADAERGGGPVRHAYRGGGRWRGRPGRPPCAGDDRRAGGAGDALRQGHHPCPARPGRRCICRRARARSPMSPARATRWSRRLWWRWRPARRCPRRRMLANITAGIAVGKQGTATVGRDELLAALRLDELVVDRPARWPAGSRRSRVSRHGAQQGCGWASPMAAST